MSLKKKKKKNVSKYFQYDALVHVTFGLPLCLLRHRAKANKQQTSSRYTLIETLSVRFGNLKNNDLGKRTTSHPKRFVSVFSFCFKSC